MASHLNRVDRPGISRDMRGTRDCHLDIWAPELRTSYHLLILCFKMTGFSNNRVNSGVESALLAIRTMYAMYGSVCYDWGEGFWGSKFTPLFNSFLGVSFTRVVLHDWCVVHLIPHSIPFHLIWSLSILNKNKYFFVIFENLFYEVQKSSGHFGTLRGKNAGH